MAITTLNSTDSGATSRTTINDNFTDLDTTKADLASPAFTGTVTLPTGLTGSLRADAGVVSVEASSSVAVETTSGATHSLTTTANQKVVVWAKGTVNFNMAVRSTITLSLKYNGVAKDTVKFGWDDDGNGSEAGFSLMYTEIPGAATADITVDGGTVSEVVIIVMKIG